jgi:hypothetical protein
MFFWLRAGTAAPAAVHVCFAAGPEAMVDAAYVPGDGGGRHRDPPARPAAALQSSLPAPALRQSARTDLDNLRLTQAGQPSQDSMCPFSHCALANSAVADEKLANHPQIGSCATMGLSPCTSKGFKSSTWTSHGPKVRSSSRANYSNCLRFCLREED